MTLSLCLALASIAFVVAQRTSKLDDALSRLAQQQQQGDQESATKTFSTAAAENPNEFDKLASILSERAKQKMAALSQTAKFTAAVAKMQADGAGASSKTIWPSQSALESMSGVPIYAIAQGDSAELLEALTTLGLVNGAASGRIVSGSLPKEQIGALEGVGALHFAALDRRATHSGAALSQGDKASGASTARQRLGVTGKGIKVGILSDSFECIGSIAADVAAGELPVDTVVLEDINDGCSIDEGRAMAQIVHDLAPDASIRFCSAFNGFVQFAECIDRLVADGCDVIVDDVGYFFEAMFQDDLIAQAVDRAASAGVAYFSSAGNSARKSYEAPFLPSVDSFTIQIDDDDSNDDDDGDDDDANDDDDDRTVVSHSFSGDTADDDDPFVILFQTSSQASEIILTMNWDDSSASATPSTADDDQPTRSDVILCAQLFSANDGPIGGFCLRPIRGEPKQIIGLNRLPAGFYFALMYVFANVDQPLPGRIKLVFDGVPLLVLSDDDTRSSTCVGHSNAAGAMAVGAVFYQDTPAFGVNPPVIEDFSSAGGTPILFDVNGVRLSTPTDRRKPEISCIDGADTTFFPPGGFDFESNGFPNFFGTSAAAPHAAAIAALMLEAQPTLTVQEIYSTLKNTAIDMGVAGFDYDSGAGLCNAPEAVQAASNTRPSVTAESDGSALTLCIAHGTVSTGTCGSNNNQAKRKRVVTATGITRVSFQTHLNYARLEHKSDSNCGPSVTLRVDNRIVWKSSTTKFTRTGSVDGNALVDLADGTHTATLSISLEKCHDARFSIEETAIVCTRVADVDSITLRGALLDDDTSSDFSSSSSSS